MRKNSGMNFNRTTSSLRSARSSAVSIAVDNFFDVDMVSPSQQDSMLIGGDAQSDKRRRKSSVPTGLLTPSMIRSKGLEFVKGHLRPGAPLAAFDLPTPTYQLQPAGHYRAVQSGFEIRKFDTDSAPCHFVGPADTLLSPLSSGVIPYVTTPDNPIMPDLRLPENHRIHEEICVEKRPLQRSSTIHSAVMHARSSVRPYAHSRRRCETPADSAGPKLTLNRSKSRESHSHHHHRSVDRSNSPTVSPTSCMSFNCTYCRNSYLHTWHDRMQICPTVSLPLDSTLNIDLKTKANLNLKIKFQLRPVVTI